MVRLLLAAAAFSLVGTTAFADPADDREALMKSFGAALGQLAPIAKGEKPFDAAAVMTALETLNTQAQKLDVAALFPAGSDAGSRASPKIWEDPAGFQAAADKFKADVASVVAAPPAD